jgi:hypothetical protein
LALALVLGAAGCGGASPEEASARGATRSTTASTATPGRCSPRTRSRCRAPERKWCFTRRPTPPRFNTSLLCQGEIIALSSDENRVTATFLLDQRGTFACPSPSTVDRAVFTVEDGRIVRWEQLPD